MTLSAAVVLTAIAAVDVSGTSTCPRPEEVAARLSEVPPSVLDPSVRMTAILTGQEGGVRVEVHTADGALFGQKLLASSGTCADLASAVTAMLLAWAHEYSAANTAPPPAPAAPSEDLSGATPEKKALENKPKPFAALDVEAGLAASIATGGFAIGGMVGASASPIEGHLGGDLSLWALGARPAPGTTGSWERFALCAGPHYRIPFATLALDFDADVFAALLSTVPEAAGASTLAFDPGVSGAVRVIGHGGFWAEARGIGWPLPHGFPEGGAIPQYEGLIAAGIVWSTP